VKSSKLRRRLLRGAIWALLTVTVLAALGLGGGYLWLRRSLPMSEGDVVVAGLQAPVDVVRDVRGVPHIFAASEPDAYRALGFVHAQDRLWQMDFLRRLGMGRLSEAVGEATLPIDRFLRTLDLYGLAQRQTRALSDPARQALQAYADGVNAAIRDPAFAAPPEFVLLRHEPEPWEPAHSVVWGRLMGVQLSQEWRHEILRARLREILPTERIEELFPPDGDDAPTTIAAPGDVGLLPPYSASNAWVVAGRRTASGLPILANDPHLGFEAPGIWYLARIVTPELVLTGATVPGVPFPVLGHNGHVAWGITTTHADTDDLVIETIDPADPSRYLTESGPMPFLRRDERIGLKDGTEVPLVVRSTRHGPIISEVVASTRDIVQPGQVVALASTNLAPGDRIAEGLFQLIRATDWTGFKAAALDFSAPVQNIFYADTVGQTGMITPGRVPVRRTGDGNTPTDGRAGPAWRNLSPADAAPQTLDPASGLIVNANNRVVRDSHPYLITKRWPAGFRAERATTALNQNDKHTVEDSLALQMDNVSLAARQLLPLLLQVEPANDRQMAAVDILRAWNGEMARDRIAPMLYAAWTRALVRRIAADELGGLFNAWWGDRPRFLISVLTDRRHWCDRTDTQTVEACGDALIAALEDALEELTGTYGEDMQEWRWARAHVARFDHKILGSLPVLSDLAGFKIATDGADHTLNRGQTYGGASPTPYAHVHGAGVRAVYDLADLDASRFSLAGGQSGNPLSPHYDDLLTPWRDGVSFTLTGSRDELLRAGGRLLRLRPESGD